MQLVTDIRLFRNPYTIVYISKEQILMADKDCCKSIGGIPEYIEIGDSLKIIDNNHPKRGLKLHTSALFLQPFVKEMFNSEVYRENVLTHFCQLYRNPTMETINFRLYLDSPHREIIDYAWNVRMLQLVWTKVEIEHAFSWLSTLGGAYSALGDLFDYCAEEAGRISIRQYKLSLMLGDDSLAARSRLYSALAFAQKGNLKVARHIVRNIAAFARKSHDVKLNRMCQGVWVKLQYLRQTQSAHAS